MADGNELLDLDGVGVFRPRPERGRQLRLEARIAKLEKSAKLFEEHRQAWINLNKGLAKLDKQRKREERQRVKRKKKNDPLFARISNPVEF